MTLSILVVQSDSSGVKRTVCNGSELENRVEGTFHVG